MFKMLSLKSWKLSRANLQRKDANFVSKLSRTFYNRQKISCKKDPIQISGNFLNESCKLNCIPYSNKFIPSIVNYHAQERVFLQSSHTIMSVLNQLHLNKPILSLSLCRQLHTQSLLVSHSQLPSQSCVQNQLPSQFQSSFRSYCSALFVTNDKLSQLNNHVTPTFDIEYVLKNKQNILDNLIRRKLDTSQYDFTEMEEKFKEFLKIEKIITNFEHKLIELEQYLLKNKGKLNDEQIQAKYTERRELKLEMRKFNDFILDFQTNVVVKVLQLPNELDSRTPNEYVIISEFTPEASVNKSSEKVTKKLEKVTKTPEKVTKISEGIVTKTPDKNLTKKANLETLLNKYVQFSNRLDVHYLGDAAKFEYLSPIVLKNYFSTKHSFIPFTNTDLAKGVIVEGCGTPYLCPYNNIVLANNELEVGDIGYNERRYHLVGGGAMEMFCAFHTNHSISVKELPVKYVASGKKYGFHNLICNTKKDTNTHEIFHTDTIHHISDTKKDMNINEDVQKISHAFDTNTLEEVVNISHLYNSLQKETINLFIGTDSHEKLHLQFENMQTILESIIRVLNIPYRLCQTPASNLHPNEALKIEFQVYSKHLESWVTCMDVCLNNDYVSKRLTMCHHSSVTSYDRHYLNILNANVYLNVLLVNLIEHEKELDVNVLSDRLNKISST